MKEQLRLETAASTPVERELAAEKVSFAYGSRRVLRDASLTVRPGRVTMLLGANGSGKSTLMRCVLGILRPAEGTVRIGAVDVLGMTPRQRARHLAYVPQSTLVAESGLTVYDTIDSGRGPQARRDRRSQREILELLESLQLVDRALDRVAELSGGERQRAIIGRALAQRTPYLLLDEPVSALDLRHQVDILDLLRRLARREGVGVLAIVHDINLAARYADEVLVMLHGRTVAAGPPAQALTAELLQAVYDTPVTVHHVAGHVVVVPDSSARDHGIDPVQYQRRS